MNSPLETPRRPRLLLVDDHEVGRITLARLLDILGFEVTAVENGSLALEALNSRPAFEFVLTDIRLPDLDGREIVHVVKGMMPATRIALITGWDLDKAEQERLEVDWIFFKPLDIHAIVAKLRGAGNPGEAEAVRVESRPAVETRP